MPRRQTWRGVACIRPWSREARIRPWVAASQSGRMRARASERVGDGAFGILKSHPLSAWQRRPRKPRAGRGWWWCCGCIDRSQSQTRSERPGLAASLGCTFTFRGGRAGLSGTASGVTGGSDDFAVAEPRHGVGLGEGRRRSISLSRQQLGADRNAHLVGIH